MLHSFSLIRWLFVYVIENKKKRNVLIIHFSVVLSGWLSSFPVGYGLSARFSLIKYATTSLLNNLNEYNDFINNFFGKFALKFTYIQVDEYLTERGSEVEQEVAADITLQILDVVLKSEHSLNSQQVID